MSSLAGSRGSTAAKTFAAVHLGGLPVGSISISVRISTGEQLGEALCEQGDTSQSRTHAAGEDASRLYGGFSDASPEYATAW